MKTKTVTHIVKLNALLRDSNQPATIARIEEFLEVKRRTAQRTPFLWLTNK